jgi:hypothetical protein
MCDMTKASAVCSLVMAGLVPAIHGPGAAAQEGVDARDEHRHDVSKRVGSEGGRR